jgi:hypothetical protein
MSSKLEKLAIKFCEKLPLNITIYEKDGFCKIPNEYCKYCKEKDKIYWCNKKTYTSEKKLKYI